MAIEDDEAKTMQQRPTVRFTEFDPEMFVT
jgi:hypothetical protein